MKIADILRVKGSDVTTIGPDESVSDLLAALAERNVGALVVSVGESVHGVVSERDVVRQLHTSGTDILRHTVADIMTAEVISCTSTDDLDDIAHVMTERRVRHMPVIDNGQLAGIVTIGDVVLHRSRELEQQRRDLEQYIAG